MTLILYQMFSALWMQLLSRKALVIFIPWSSPVVVLIWKVNSLLQTPSRKLSLIIKLFWEVKMLFSGLLQT